MRLANQDEQTWHSFRPHCQYNTRQLSISCFLSSMNKLRDLMEHAAKRPRTSRFLTLCALDPFLPLEKKKRKKRKEEEEEGEEEEERKKQTNKEEISSSFR